MNTYKTVEVARIIGKILLLSFQDDEEELINSVLSVLESGKKVLAIQAPVLPARIQCLDITIYLDTREVVRDQKKINLTFTEFEILKLLAQSPGSVFSKEQIYDIVWSETYSEDYNIVMEPYPIYL